MDAENKAAVKIQAAFKGVKVRKEQEQEKDNRSKVRYDH